MPYKVEGSAVMVLRGNRWQVLKRHKTRKKALAHLAALKANVRTEA